MNRENPKAAMPLGTLTPPPPSCAGPHTRCLPSDALPPSRRPRPTPMPLRPGTRPQPPLLSATSP
ncbi:UNVERIFIED_CONTAM: hypothetical protein Slati_2136200 [Sesamum latifolium]|uniref:Uncharacterized protein n=1 Tax=Sesamum latifolium TaxID=2727402 RepID=A0AAW2WVK5_9LAMI